MFCFHQLYELFKSNDSSSSLNNYQLMLEVSSSLAILCCLFILFREKIKKKMTRFRIRLKLFPLYIKEEKKKKSIKLFLNYHILTHLLIYKFFLSTFFFVNTFLSFFFQKFQHAFFNFRLKFFFH